MWPPKLHMRRNLGGELVGGFDSERGFERGDELSDSVGWGVVVGGGSMVAQVGG